MRSLLGMVSVVVCLAFSLKARAQAYAFSLSTVNVTVFPGADHVPLTIPVTYTPATYNFSKLTCASDASWVAPAVDATSGSVVLTFATKNLINRSYTATITLTDGVTPATLFVKATVSTVNIVALAADPTRSRVYAVQQDGLNAGGIVVFDPLKETYVGNITVGEKPADLVVRSDGSELLAICSVAKKIYAIDLQKLAVKEIITLPGYVDWGSADTSAHVAYGPGAVIYFTDGAGAPTLRVFDRAAGTVLQTLTEAGSSGFGFGDFVTTRDFKRLFAWAQYGWTAGNAGSLAVSYLIGADGRLTASQETAKSYNGDPKGMLRDPLNTPALVNEDGTIAVLKQYAFDATNLSTIAQSTPSPVFAISPGAEVLSTATAIYQRSTGNKLVDLPTSTSVQAITYDYSRLVYFNSTTKGLATLNLTAALGEAVLGRQRSPAEKAIVQTPAKLQWSPVLGVNRYRVYLGTSQTAVSQATTASTAYLGEVTSPSITLTSSLTAGTTYYWRVDTVTTNDVVAGAVFSFTVSNIASDTSAIKASTVQVQKNLAVTIGLSSSTAGKAWSASSPAGWISFSAAAGATPASLVVSLDATALPTGLNTSTVSITTAEGSFSIPVTLQVDSLQLTQMRSSPGTTKIYAVSEDTSVASPRAYLLEIDTLTKSVKRVVPVGSSVTDLAVHPADQRIYVPNWKAGTLLAVNLTTFAVEKTYGFTPAAPTGYGGGDVYRVSPGSAGRLVLEEEDQWIKVSLFDTAAGKTLGNSYQREGGGGTDPTGRCYYHGDNNISDASLHKFDLLADQLTELGEIRIAGTSYYGTRTVVVSEDGKHIFWNGGAFNDALALDWLISDEIFCTSGDGRFAFSSSRIYDVAKKQLVGPMPVTTSVSAYNSATNQLVLQNGKVLGFYSLVGLGLLGSDMAPLDQAIVTAPVQLKWSALPGVASYRVYLGISLNAVSAAGGGSAEFKGEITGTSYSPSALTAGTTYYWRVDLVTTDGVVAGTVASFTLAAIAPSVAAIEAATVQGDSGYTVPIALTSGIAGLGWTASSPAAWVKFTAASGVAPGTLDVKLDAGNLAPGSYESTITVATNGGGFTLPVKLSVDTLNLTVMRSDPASAKVYAVSESGSAATARAFLLEIDSAQKKITRVVAAGSSVTDLAIHAGDNRIYVTNWKLGSLLGFNRDTLALAATLPFQPFSSAGYANGDVYRISAGGPGRLIVEEEDQWIDISLYDTVAAKVLTKTSAREGGGSYAPDLRYYYHGDDNSSAAALTRYDTLADTFTSVKSSGGGGSGYGSRTVVVSEDGSRIFWSGSVFDPQLTPQWAIGETIFACSTDGRFAFAKAKIYDVTTHQAIFSMPGAGDVSAFNSNSGKLVLQKNQSIGFYAVDPSAPLPTPVLSAGSVGKTSLVLSWQIDSLQTGFTLQSRVVGTANWTDLASGISPTASTYTVGGLATNTAYEFRLKADSPLTSSAWSSVAKVTTLPTASRLVNIATRAYCGSGNSVTIGGFVVSGSGYKRVLVRAVGPSLTAQGVGAAEVLSDPFIEVHDAIHGNSIIATNDDWGTYNAANIAATASAVGASALLASDTKSSAVVLTLASGVYSFVVKGQGSTSGVVLLEVYDADAVSTASNFSNIATRAYATTGNGVTIGGFVIAGDVPKQVLLRAVGPTLTKQGLGVTEVLADPTIELHDASHGNAIIRTNDNWGDVSAEAAAITSAGARIGATPFDTTDTKSAALLMTLQPGVYSFIASGKAGTSGIVLVEVYDAD